MARIAVLFNADHGGDAGPDATSVEGAASAIADALVQAGHAAELVAVRGLEVVATLAGRVDLVFNVCEAMAGDAANEPTFAGALALRGLRHTGADLVTLALCLHKQRTKDILNARGVATPPHRHLRGPRDLEDPGLDALDYPWFVKLVHEDASLGISEANVVRSAPELRGRARELMTAHRQGVLAERFVDGREINVTLLGTGDDAVVLPLHEIDFSAMPSDRPHIVSYAAKWHEDHVDYVGTKPVPLVSIAPGVREDIERVARGAYTALELRDYGRVDLRVDAEGRAWVIDVNPNPDLSPDAGVARAAAAAGMSYAQLVDRIAQLALAR
jgi:D-alanine-D-alanine ligase